MLPQHSTADLTAAALRAAGTRGLARTNATAARVIAVAETGAQSAHLLPLLLTSEGGAGRVDQAALARAPAGEIVGAPAPAHPAPPDHAPQGLLPGPRDPGRHLPPRPTGRGSGLVMLTSLTCHVGSTQTAPILIASSSTVNLLPTSWLRSSEQRRGANPLLLLPPPSPCAGTLRREGALRVMPANTPTPWLHLLLTPQGTAAAAHRGVNRKCRRAVVAWPSGK